MRRESKAIYGARFADDKDDGGDTGVVGCGLLEYTSIRVGAVGVKGRCKVRE